MSNVLFMLLGAALVCVGVVISAVADRIRGVKPTRVTERALFLERQPKNKASKAEPPPPDVMQQEVEGALTKMGFVKAEAHELAVAVPATDRHSHENWIRAALRKSNVRKIHAD